MLQNTVLGRQIYIEYQYVTKHKIPNRMAIQHRCYWIVSASPLPSPRISSSVGDYGSPHSRGGTAGSLSCPTWCVYTLERPCGVLTLALRASLFWSALVVTCFSLLGELLSTPPLWACLPSLLRTSILIWRPTVRLLLWLLDLQAGFLS